MQVWFKDWFNSPYYHLLYQNRDESEASQFIERLIDHLHPPKEARMLDIACGRGRHSLQLASKGYDVTGIDLSLESVKFAEQFSHDKLHFFVHDMRRPFWIGYFHYAFNFFTSFGYFDTKREHDDALRTMAQSLQPGGYLVMDYLNVEFAERHLQPESVSVIDEIEFHISRQSTDSHFIKSIDVKDQKIKSSFHFEEKVAKFDLETLSKMMEKQGLKVKEIFGNYDLSTFKKTDSPRLILVACKEQ